MSQIRALAYKYRVIITFALVGFVNTGADFAVFSVFLLIINANVLISQVFGYIAGLTCSFFLNKYVTFKSKKKSLKQAILFGAVNFTTLSISLIAIYFWSSVVGIQEHIVKLFFVAPLTMVLNFLGYRYIVFPKKYN